MIKKKKYWLQIFLRIILIMSFIVIALLLIMTASGYQINLKAKTLEKTALITIKSDPKNASLYLNSQLKGKTPYKIVLLKGQYYLKLEISGYQSWEKTVFLSPGQYLKLQPVLFLEKPQIQEITNPEEMTSFKEIGQKVIEAELPQNAQDVAFDENKKMILYRTDSEIWLLLPNESQKERNKIVARFKNPIKKVMFYPDYQHILYVMDEKLSIIEISGTNDTFLAPTKDLNLKISPDGRKILISSPERNKVLAEGEVLISEAERYYEITIR